MYVVIALTAIIISTLIIWRLVRNYFPAIKRKWIFSFLTIIIFISGILVLLKTLDEFKAFEIRQSWKSVQGIITGSNVIGDRTKQPQIKYTYKVNNQLYKGESRLGISMFASSKSQEQTARIIKSNYKVGDSLTVFYDPQKIKSSRLKITPHWSTYMQYSFSIFILSIAISMSLKLFILVKR